MGTKLNLGTFLSAATLLMLVLGGWHATPLAARPHRRPPWT